MNTPHSVKYEEQINKINRQNTVNQEKLYLFQIHTQPEERRHSLADDIDEAETDLK